MRRLLIALSLFIALNVAAFAQDKKRVAVLDFEYSTVHSSSSAFFGTNYDLGRGIRDLVVEVTPIARSLPSRESLRR